MTSILFLESTFDCQFAYLGYSLKGFVMGSVHLQVLTEYVLVSVTSAVTVTVAGIVKEAVTILV